MSVSLVSLFPDEADIAKTCLLITQTTLNKTQIIKKFKWFIGLHFLRHH